MAIGRLAKHTGTNIETIRYSTCPEATLRSVAPIVAMRPCPAQFVRARRSKSGSATSRIIEAS
jgi:hypothetical protein